MIGFLAILPLYFLSLEHQKLMRVHGEEKGTRLGEVYGLVSGWGFFLFWTGIWFSPQPTVMIPLFWDQPILLPLFNVDAPLSHIFASIPLILTGSWLGINGVREVSLRVTETHRPVRVISSGVYSVVRHPQYLGGFLGHLGVSLLLCRLYSLLFTPMVLGVVYLISWKEEAELLKEFGDEYRGYMERVPMLIPRPVLRALKLRE